VLLKLTVTNLEKEIKQSDEKSTGKRKGKRKERDSDSDSLKALEREKRDSE
jgi:hypothetical protein